MAGTAVPSGPVKGKGKSKSKRRPAGRGGAGSPSGGQVVATVAAGGTAIVLHHCDAAAIPDVVPPTCVTAPAPVVRLAVETVAPAHADGGSGSGDLSLPGEAVHRKVLVVAVTDDSTGE